MYLVTIIGMMICTGVRISDNPAACSFGIPCSCILRIVKFSACSAAAVTHREINTRDQQTTHGGRQRSVVATMHNHDHGMASQSIVLCSNRLLQRPRCAAIVCFNDPGVQQSSASTIVRGKFGASNRDKVYETAQQKDKGRPHVSNRGHREAIERS